MKSFSHLYELSFEEREGELHFAAHSHHPWPDCTFDAQKEYWKDSVKHLDEKWDYIFEQVIPQTQRHIAETLNLSSSEMIAIAPNTHEFVVRLYSCFDRPLRLLTTDSEFHSFRRQTQRLIEAKKVVSTVVPVEPYETFEERWNQEIQNSKFDMIFTSQVFFNSGLMCAPFETWIPKVPEETMIVIDGYHAFCAVPTDLKKYQDRIFYMAGGYKYAQSGEGICFLAVPKTSRHRPLNTGWYASFETLNQETQGAVEYSETGMRFAGATFDASGCYRMNAVMSMMKREHLDVSKIHERVMAFKKYFLEELSESSVKAIDVESVITSHGKMTEAHFVTFRTPHANKIEKKLLENHIVVDSRGDRLRFGFGLYHDLTDIDHLIVKLEEVLKESF